MNEQKYMWSYAGTALLISIWSQSSVQKQLKATLRNQGIWDGVARYMCRRGFNVNGRQCRTRIKNILVRYRDAKKTGNISGTGIEPYFHDIDRVMALRNAKVSCSVLPYVSPDPLASLEHASEFEEIRHYGAPDLIAINVKKELSVPSNTSEEDSQEHMTNQHMYFGLQNEHIDDDRSPSADGMRSPILHAAEKCEVIAGENPLPMSTNGYVSTQAHHNERPCLEQLVVRAIESQTEAVTKVLTAQHNLAKQLLEADRERQVRLEYKLDSILERLDYFMSSRMTKDCTGEEKNSKLNCLLDRLDQVLPFLPSSLSAPKQKDYEKIQGDKVERILNRLDQLFPSASSSSKLIDDDD